MRVALDTNRYTDFMRGEAAVADVVEEAEEIVLPFVVLGELRGGFAHGTKKTANERRLDEFLLERDVVVVYADEPTTRHYAAVYQQLRGMGKMIPLNDLWIAALVIQHGLALCSRDGHFDHLPQIRRV